MSRIKNTAKYHKTDFATIFYTEVLIWIVVQN
nr:MAG TPA_asm: hypothetical protein [Caudoviricetes sp.]